jgi:phosphoribosylformimino-5-aminoimidazole carboxamide ribotide isomerase
MKIIPAIDLREGRVVRLRQGDFAQMRAFDNDPVALAARYAGAGAELLHLVDLDGARAGRPLQLALIARIAASGLRVQAGGGVRTRDDVQRLLDAGVSRVVIGSIAVRAPSEFADWLQTFGAECVCLAMDLRRGDDGRWYPAVDAWQATSKDDYAALLQRFADAGLRHVLTTDVAHDGMAAGPNLALYRLLAARWPSFSWIASGGVRDLTDVAELRGSGVAACVAGTALLEGSLPLEALSCSRAA